MKKQKAGNKLVAGDRVSVWWNPNGDVIERFTYPEVDNATMQNCFPDGYAFAQFLSGMAMTIDYRETYSVFVPDPPSNGSMRHFGSDRGLA